MTAASPPSREQRRANLHAMPEADFIATGVSWNILAASGKYDAAEWDTAVADVRQVAIERELLVALERAVRAAERVEREAAETRRRVREAMVRPKGGGDGGLTPPAGKA